MVQQQLLELRLFEHHTYRSHLQIQFYRNLMNKSLRMAMLLFHLVTAVEVILLLKQVFLHSLFLLLLSAVTQHWSLALTAILAVSKVINAALPVNGLVLMEVVLPSCVVVSLPQDPSVSPVPQNFHPLLSAVTLTPNLAEAATRLVSTLRCAVLMASGLALPRTGLSTVME
jgi:hypothetical protein